MSLLKNLLFNYPILIALLLLPDAALSQNQKPGREYDQYIQDYVVRKNVPSLSAGLLSKDKIIWSGAAGFSDLEHSVPATGRTIYRIASISKSITAVAVMILVERGRINLDEDIRKYVPYFPQKKWKVTTRHLLNHTSGIRDYRDGEFDSKTFFSSTREALAVIVKDSLIFQPGSRYLYTTLGYNLLAAVIEGVSGLTFVEFVRRNIFLPAEMRSTFPDVQTDVITNRARGYRKNNQRKFINAPLADLSIKYAGGGFLSTSEDLLRFASFLLNGKYVSINYVDSMIAPTKLTNGQIRNYGLGFTMGNDANGRKFFFHSGSGTGFSSNLVFYPDEKIAAVHLINFRERERDHLTVKRLNIQSRNPNNPAFDLISIFRKESFPPISFHLSEKLMEITIASGVDSALSLYPVLNSDSLDMYIINEEEKLVFGYDLIIAKRIRDAITVFKFFLNEQPDFMKYYIGLADAYFEDGNRGLALKNYRYALRFDQKNSYINERIRRLEGN